jgi:hypothetical protein
VRSGSEVPFRWLRKNAEVASLDRQSPSSVDRADWYFLAQPGCEPFERWQRGGEIAEGVVLGTA